MGSVTPKSELELFRDLFVLDMANNHQGSVTHGLKIIHEVGSTVRKYKLRSAIKFQFRQLKSFVHPDHQTSSNHKYVKRFMSTRLTLEDFKTLYDAVREEGLTTICTPFDEESVEVAVALGSDMLKVASCSATDWPLLESIAAVGLPVIVSTGGLKIADVDNLVSFFFHRGIEFAIMHCVSLYPTPSEQLYLKQIAILRTRYPGYTIGWSTHEEPSELTAVSMAYAMGARLFERHVGVAAEGIQLNAYTSSPSQLGAWFATYKHTKEIWGSGLEKEISKSEVESLCNLSRGVYLCEDVEADVEINNDQVYFAIPFQDGQVDAGSWRAGIIPLKDCIADSPLLFSDVEIPLEPEYHVLKTAVHEVKAMLNEALIKLSPTFQVEFSHHKGMRDFRETGAVIINCVNRQYCKKLIVLLPGQNHPLHYHKTKEETFQVLTGTLHLEVDKRTQVLQAGDQQLIQSGVWHSFWSHGGCIFEEISSTHYDDDSYYNDAVINAMKRSDRKTVVENWGREEIQHIVLHNDP